MPKTKVTVTKELGVFGRIAKQWPSFRYSLLSNIGYEGRRELYESRLRGQVVKLTESKYPRDIANRRTVAYYIDSRRTKVNISSYVLNLHNPREVYDQTAPTVESRIQGFLLGYDRVLQRRFDRLDRR